MMDDEGFGVFYCFPLDLNAGLCLKEHFGSVSSIYALHKLHISASTSSKNGPIHLHFKCLTITFIFACF